VSEELIWAPWRLPYVQGNKEQDLDGQPLEFLPGADKKCFLCQCVADADDRRRWVIDRTEHTVTVLNIFPYNNGHLLVSPLEHRGRIEDFDDTVQLALTRKISQMIRLLEKAIRAQGFNVGLNLGTVAGAGVPKHLHWHIVPRWNGDTNFMPSIAGIKVIPQSLEALWELLRAELAK